MKVSVFGLGFVGSITAGCLADAGHDVIGVDIDHQKVEAMSLGQSPVLEPGLDTLLDRNVRAGRLRADASLDAAVDGSDISLICIDVPTSADGSQETDGLDRLVRELGEAIARKRHYHSVAIRSTVLPTTTRRRLAPILEQATGSFVGEGFGLAHHPEFVRQGAAISDFRHGSRCIIGEIDKLTADRLVDLFGAFSRAVFRTSPELSEAAKYTDNAWHALKVTFANEIGTICNSGKIDSQTLMEMFCADEILNLSSAYLRPGFAFGGTCLSKDINALAHWSKQAGLDLPLLSHIVTSNHLHLQRSIDWLIAHGKQRFALLGLAYKPGTGELRSSPFLHIAQALTAAGREVRAFDPDVYERLHRLPSHAYHESVAKALHPLLTDDVHSLIAWSDTVVLCSRGSEYRKNLQFVDGERVVLDFARNASADPGRSAYAAFV